MRRVPAHLSAMLQRALLSHPFAGTLAALMRLDNRAAHIK